MEWVETTGRTIEEAKEAALDELGVDEVDAEFEVVNDARPGLFGRLRSEARVRARVRPTAPRPKEDRRERRRRTAGESTAPGAATSVASAATDSAGAAAFDAGPRPAETNGDQQAEVGNANGSIGAGDRDEGAGNRRSPDARPAGSGNSSRSDDARQEGVGVEVDLDTQGEVAREFLTQLISEFGVESSVTVTRPDADTVELQLTGSDLGILIGPKGSTLLSVQNLVRNVVHHQTGATNGHINVDVGGYRQKRTEALVKFARQVASTVRQSGVRTAMEPMSSVDRKVVHDTISEIDGVSTVSEGEEPRRRVVVLPAPVES
jgi:spoIIIJ-associated protein